MTDDSVSIALTVNGSAKTGMAEPRMLLADFLRLRGIESEGAGDEHRRTPHAAPHLEVADRGRAGRDAHRGRGACTRRSAPAFELTQPMAQLRIFLPQNRDHIAGFPVKVK